MTAIIRPTRFLGRPPGVIKPPPGACVDWGHGITQALKCAALYNEGVGHPINLANGFLGDTGVPGWKAYLGGYEFQVGQWSDARSRDMASGGVTGQPFTVVVLVDLITLPTTGQHQFARKFHWTTSTNNAGWTLTIDQTNAMWFGLYNNNDASITIASHGLSAGKIYCFALRYKGTGTNGAEIWQDGKNKATGTLSGGWANDTSSFRGSSNNGGGNSYSIALYFWKRTLSDDELIDMYADPFLPIYLPRVRRFVKLTANNFTKLLTETITLTDSLAKLTSKPLTETVTLADAIAKLTGKSLTESVSLADTLLKMAGKLLTETITPSDSLIRDTIKPLTEGITLSDVLAKLTGKPLSEGITLSDTLTKQLIFTKDLTETIMLTDTLVRSTTKGLGETITLTDTQVKLLQRSLTETLTLTDVLAKQLNRLLSETVTLSDTVAANALYARVLTETLTLTDALSRLTTKVLTETITPSDVIKRDVGKVLSEAISLSDVVNKSITKLPFTELITLTDTVAAAIVVVVHYLRAINQALASGQGTGDGLTPGAASTPGEVSGDGSGKGLTPGDGTGESGSSAGGSGAGFNP